MVLIKNYTDPEKEEKPKCEYVSERSSCSADVIVNCCSFLSEVLPKLRQVFRDFGGADTLVST